MINSKETALLVIDMQNDFVEEGAVLEVPATRNNLKENNKSHHYRNND